MSWVMHFSILSFRAQRWPHGRTLSTSPRGKSVLTPLQAGLVTCPSCTLNFAWTLYSSRTMCLFCARSTKTWSASESSWQLDSWLRLKGDRSQTDTDTGGETSVHALKQKESDDFSFGFWVGSTSLLACGGQSVDRMSGSLRMTDGFMDDFTQEWKHHRFVNHSFCRFIGEEFVVQRGDDAVDLHRTVTHHHHQVTDW